MEQEPLLPEILPPDDGNGRHAPNNGNGRPKGARNLKHKTLERVARSQSVPIVQKLCQQALEGDVLAARVILDRIWPRPKSAPIAVDLAPTRTPAELRAAMHNLLADVASGRIAPDDGQALVAIMRDVLESHRVQVFDAVGSIEVENTNARELLEQRLARAIEERSRQAAAAGADAE